MKRDNFRREVFDRKIDPRKAKFHLSHRALVRVVLVSILPMLLLVSLAYYLQQYLGMALAIVWFGFAAIWQILAYGYGAISERDLKATNYYPSAYLVFALAFLFGIVGFVVWRLWGRFPN